LSAGAGSDGRASACLGLALAGAVAASVGDLAMLWVAWAHDGRLGLARPPGGTLLAGHYLGVLGIPLYGLGYWVLARGLHIAAPRAALPIAAPRAALAVAALGAIGSVVGAVVHGLTGVLIATAIRTGAGTAPDALGDLPEAAYLLPLWAIVGGALAFGSLVFATIVARGGTRWPRWLAVVNPLALTIVIAVIAASSAAPLPALAALVAPAAPNLAHVVVFAAALSVRRRS
jgi:hypothetical protein